MRFYKLSYDDDNYPSAEEVSDRDEIVGWCPVAGANHGWIPKWKEGEEAILTIDLPSPKGGDFLTTWTWSWMITDKVSQLFEDQGFTGYKLKPVRINKVKRMRSTSPPIPKLWELVITGFAGMAHPDSGIKPIHKCEYCNGMQYSNYTNSSALIDHSQWDGSDFFFIYPLSGFIFITERVKNFIEEQRLTGSQIIPLDEIPVGISQTLGGGRLYYYWEKSRLSLERVKAFGESLGIWVDPERLWQRAIQLEEEEIWPPGLGRGNNPWNKEWRDFLRNYLLEGFLSPEIIFEQLEKMLKKYTNVQAIEEIDKKIEEIKKIRL